MLDFLRIHESVLWWLGIFSVLSFVGTLVAIPMLVARIPAEYFTRNHRYCGLCRRSLLHMIGVVFKNVLGVVMVLLGLAMLVLPGQGTIPILIGLMLMNFPGKWWLEKKIVHRPVVFRVLNWMRAKSSRPPLSAPL